MQRASNGVMFAGGVAWAALTAWHGLIIVQFGWPAPFWFGHLFMAGPAIALAAHTLIFSFGRIRQSWWGLGLEVMSLVSGLVLAYAEVSMHFIGYE